MDGISPIVGGDPLKLVVHLLIFFLGTPYFAFKILEGTTDADWAWLTRLPWGARFEFAYKRIVAYLFAGLVSTLLWGFGLFMRFYEPPGPDVQAWINTWFTVVWPTGLITQLVHGFLRKREPELAEYVHGVSYDGSAGAGRSPTVAPPVRFAPGRVRPPHETLGTTRGQATRGQARGDRGG